MAIVEYSKCKKCGAILHVNELKENDVGEGKICRNSKACEERYNKNRNNSDK